ncbi:MAG: dienelactone hydrolase family protein [Actinomycetota bacterium]
MADLLLFHHALGLTEGVHAFAEALRSAGHEVTTPDLFDGVTFSDIQAGVDHAEQIGFPTLIAEGVDLARQLPDGGVVAGFSLGGLPAQAIAHTKPGVAGLVLLHGGDVPVDTFGEVWPTSVSVQVHVAEHDPWCPVEDARTFVEATDGELHSYPGDAHLFTDSSHQEYDDAATALVLERLLAFLPD